MTDIEFMDVWSSSRYNIFFWLSHLLGIFCVVYGAFSGRYNLKRYKLLIFALCCFVGVVAMIGVWEKWRIRENAAQTPKQIETIAERDGANLGVSPLYGAFVGAE